VNPSPLRRLPDTPSVRERKARAARLAAINETILDCLDRAHTLAEDADRDGYEAMRVALRERMASATAPDHSGKGR
jgi:hypothetical protein